MKFVEYANHVNAPEYVKTWVQKVMTDDIDTTEGEHVIDYLVSEDAPKHTNLGDEIFTIKRPDTSWHSVLVSVVTMITVGFIILIVSVLV